MATSNYKTINQNIAASDKIIRKIFNVAIQIRKQQKEASEQKVVSKNAYFNFKFFKVRKSSFVIAMLGLLTFKLTLFCMKQQNDYSLLNYEYYKQSVEIDSLKIQSLPQK